MDYMQIVNLIMSILGVILLVPMVPTLIFAITGALTRKTFEEQKEKLKYGIVISGRNEENVIGNLIDSIFSTNYPKDKLHVFVCAHNCTDKTAEIARAKGATVYEYNNDQEKTKGFALHYIFNCIKRDYGEDAFEGFFIFDADNLLDNEFFNKMNDAFIANGKNCIITSFRNSKNWGHNTLSALYGIMFAFSCRLEHRGRTKLGCTARILGTGFLLTKDILKTGWNNVNLSEDTDLTADEVLAGKNVVYCDEAMCFDEQPVKLKTMLRQRLRWAKGSLQAFEHKSVALFANIFKNSRGGEKPLRFSSFDTFCYVFPVGIYSTAMLVLQLILMAFAPLAGASVQTVWLDWLISTAKSLAIGYVTLFIAAIFIYIAEKKRIKNVSLSLKLSSIFLYPIFVAISLVLCVAALFIKNLSWKTIEHLDVTQHEQLQSAPTEKLQPYFADEDEQHNLDDEAAVAKLKQYLAESSKENAEKQLDKVE